MCSIEILLFEWWCAMWSLWILPPFCAVFFSKVTFFQKGERECHIVILMDDDVVDWDHDQPPQTPDSELTSLSELMQMLFPATIGSAYSALHLFAWLSIYLYNCFSKTHHQLTCQSFASVVQSIAVFFLFDKNLQRDIASYRAIMRNFLHCFWLFCILILYLWCLRFFNLHDDYGWLLSIP